ncbi:small GTP-binding protein, putative [Trichomonas vaginalis G3]|uniref:Small GTP-binding protein, putative n=1 Tax=Trichomonas vaginalis (strain ATCC PRA-98 / G3) TaxID=412133 RepID=A2DC15_TRIV3|nr:GTPase protein [Trichomonas vaginalis G3]EAY22056.1 small GTP-binding protein, putative [Trichomonas vaginalis G3]KAI5525316.1 GTPase protein [Trichomonas vaginalis G3]|eukprot:XP_001583042.1 small GTP-binding protein [Trichomonas vaginalis G3]
MSQEITLKVVVIGDSSVGKTCISLRYLTGEFSSQTTPTIAAGFCNAKVKVGKNNINLLIWDTAGQESYRSLTSQYYRETKIALIVFDLTSPQSLESVTDWHERVCEVNEGKVITVLIGNKYDLPNRRISQEQGEKMAESIGAIYRETSAVTGKGIKEVFEDACEEYLRNNPVYGGLKSKQHQQTVLKPNAEKSGCC